MSGRVEWVHKRGSILRPARVCTYAAHPTHLSRDCAFNWNRRTRTLRVSCSPGYYLGRRG
jgi:hypothetical protein